MINRLKISFFKMSSTLQKVITFLVLTIFMTLTVIFGIEENCHYLPYLSSSLIQAEAASYKFKYKNVTDNVTVKYNYTIPIYYVDNALISTTDTPPIITDGTAMCGADILFGSIDGVKVRFDKAEGKITFTYNTNTLIMYLGSKKCLLNDEETSCSLTPVRVKYSEGGIYTNLVPTRFVAESLGMEYNWNQSTSTVTIKTPKKIGYDGVDDYYLGTLGKIAYNDEIISNTRTPSYIYDDNALICLRSICNAIPGFDFEYNSKTGTIDIKYREIILKMTLQSTLTYVNGLLDTAPIAPCMIYNYDSGLKRVYIPGRYVFETLGFDYKWDSKTGTSLISETEKSGIYTTDFNEALIYDAIGEPMIIVNEDEDNTSKNDTDSDNSSSSADTSASVLSGKRKVQGYRQVLNFPIMEGIKTELIEIKDRIYDNLITFELAGNYLDFYRTQNIVNTGEAVLQLQILYYEPEDITRINLYTRTDSNGIILGHKDRFFKDRIEFTLDWPANLYDRIIVLDAGHGGTDPGTVHGGYNEKDLNFNIVYNYCRELFDKSNIKVYYSRYDDTLAPLHARPTIPARIGADMFISVHHNSYYQSSKGTTVYYSVTDKGMYNGMNSKTMAGLFSTNLVNDLGLKNNGIINHDYVVVSKENSVPAVLLEIGFMSNPDELKTLVKKSFQKKVAKSIFNTVKEIYQKY